MAININYHGPLLFKIDIINSSLYLWTLIDILLYIVLITMLTIRIGVNVQQTTSSIQSYLRLA